MGSIEPITDPPYIIKTENGILQLVNKDAANPGDILKFIDKNKEEDYIILGEKGIEYYGIDKYDYDDIEKKYYYITENNIKFDFQLV